jgi:hypothetical protein
LAARKISVASAAADFFIEGDSGFALECENGVI